MQTQFINSNLIKPNPDSSLSPQKKDDNSLNSDSNGNRDIALKGVYRQLFKENRDLDFFHNSALDSAYLDGQLTTREFVCKLLSSQMYTDYLLAVNSNYRFVQLCFERVLGRTATQDETYKWSSLIASQGITAFAKKLTSCDEYIMAFGDNNVPFRRSQAISSSNQGLPALPKELSFKRYQGEGLINQFSGYSPYIPRPWMLKAGAVITVASAIEIVRILLTVAAEALGTGL